MNASDFFVLLLDYLLDAVEVLIGEISDILGGCFDVSHGAVDALFEVIPREPHVRQPLPQTVDFLHVRAAKETQSTPF